MVSSPPEGITLKRGKKKFLVGKQIGSGACATIHELTDSNGHPTEYVVKMARAPSKTTKKQNTPEEINYSLVYYEQMIYRNHLGQIQGKFVPSIAPADYPVYGDINGYRYFSMERMGDTLASIVPTLLGRKSKSDKISMGPIAVKLLQCVQAVHGCKNIVRDIKMANFMLTGGEGTGETLEEKLASRIRLLDLATAAQGNSLYFQSKEGNGMIGTPLYASLNIHENFKCSYRDDLEATGYVLAELLMQLSSGNPSKQLPWSKERSDEDIGRMKREMVENSNSLFYQQLGDPNTISIMSQYLTAVRGCSFKKAPKYEELALILGRLDVPRIKKQSKTRTPVKKSPRRTPTRKAANAARESISSITKRGRTSRSVATQTPTKVDQRELVDMDIDDGVHMMDWESTNENDEPESDKKPKARRTREPVKRRDRVLVNERNIRRQKKDAEPEVITLDESDEEEFNEDLTIVPARLQRRGIKICIVTGPHRGESFVIEDGATETLVFGTNPSSRVGKTIALRKDNELSQTHVRLDLSLKKGMKPSVTLTSKSSGKIYVNGDSVTNTKVFIQSRIKIGSTMLELRAL